MEEEPVINYINDNINFIATRNKTFFKNDLKQNSTNNINSNRFHSIENPFKNYLQTEDTYNKLTTPTDKEKFNTFFENKKQNEEEKIYTQCITDNNFHSTAKSNVNEKTKKTVQKNYMNDLFDDYFLNNNQKLIDNELDSLHSNNKILNTRADSTNYSIATNAKSKNSIYSQTQLKKGKNNGLIIGILPLLKKLKNK